MPRTREALQAENAYATALRAIRRGIAQQLARLTIALDTEDIAAAIEEFAPTAARMIAGGQVEAQQAAAAFVSEFLASEGEETGTRRIASDIAGTNAEGRPLTSLVGGSLATGVFTMLRSGHAPDEALGHAAFAVARLAGAEITSAADREVAHQGETTSSVTGWIRVVTGRENCAGCLADASTDVHSFDEPMLRHPGCDCTRSVRLSDDPGTVERPTGEELFAAMTPEQQAAQFRTAGEEKAQLVRSGEVSLADLLKVERHAGWADAVVERPLAEVSP